MYIPDSIYYIYKIENIIRFNRVLLLVIWRAFNVVFENHRSVLWRHIFLICIEMYRIRRIEFSHKSYQWFKTHIVNDLQWKKDRNIQVSAEIRRDVKRVDGYPGRAAEAVRLAVDRWWSADDRPPACWPGTTVRIHLGWLYAHIILFRLQIHDSYTLGFRALALLEILRGFNYLTS